MGDDTSSTGDVRQKDSPCACPYCDVTGEDLYPFCSACGANLRPCPVCEKPIGKAKTVCPYCGAEVKRDSSAT